MKRTLIVTALALALVMVFSGVAMADDAEVNVRWTGSNNRVEIDFSMDIGKTMFTTDGFYTEGSFRGWDAGDRYNVSRFYTYSQGYVENGYINHITERAGNDNYTGNTSDSYVLALGGYAAMVSADYLSHSGQGQSLYGYKHGSGDFKPGWTQSTRHDNFPSIPGMYANADYYVLDRFVKSGNDNSAQIIATGSGIARLGTGYSEGRSPVGSYDLGTGNSSHSGFAAEEGSGTFKMEGYGYGSVEFNNLFDVDGNSLKASGNVDKQARLLFLAEWHDDDWSINSTRISVR